MAQSVTVTGSSATGVAATTGVIVLNPVSKSTSLMLTTVIGATLQTVQVEYSLDDPTQLGGPTATWALLSSATGIASSQSNGLSWTVLSPIGQVRINSTSGSTGTASVYTLKALQSVTA